MTTGSHIKKPGLVPGAITSASRSGGFTLIETLVVIAIAGTMAALAIAPIQSALANARITEATNTLVASLSKARSEAMMRRAETALCPAPTALPANDHAIAANDPTGQNCEPATLGWEDGYMIVFRDTAAGPNVMGQYTPIRVIDRNQQTTITAATNSASPMPVAFNRRGSLLSNSDAVFAVCDTRGPDFGRVVRVQTNGRVVVENFPANSAGCMPPVTP